MFNRRLGVGSHFIIAHGAARVVVERTDPGRFRVTAIGDVREGGAPFFRRTFDWPAGRLVLTHRGEACQILLNGKHPRDVWVHAPESFVAGRPIRPRRAAS